MRDALRKVRPTEFGDIVALVSLYRPGAMRFIDDYARGKRDPASVGFQDERLRPITEATHGCCIYQEQLMEIAKRIAGFTPAEADDLRKAVGKKKRDLMATMKDMFLAGCSESGTDRRVADDLWSLMTAAADYSFNKSHAACYALIAYRTAYLKANYPAEYMAAVISSVMSTKDKVPFFVNRCEEMGIEVLPPEVNSSDHGFVVSGKSIRFGLDAVKNVGHQAVQAIISSREAAGQFESIWDFCERVDCRAVNKKAIESLVKCGALDSTGASRRGMLEVLPGAQASGNKAQQDALLGQASIFDLEEPTTGNVNGSSPFGFPQHPPVPAIEDDRAETGAMEKETLGLFLSSHPLKEVRAALRARVESTLSQLEDKKDGDWVTVGGMITESKKIRTRNGDPMIFATLDDLEGSVELLALGAAYTGVAEAVENDAVLVIRGRVDHKDRGETKLVAQEVEVFAPSADEIEQARTAEAHAPVLRLITLAVDPGVPATFLEELKDVVQNFPGERELCLKVGDRSLVLGESFRVSGTSPCRAHLASLGATSSRR